MLFSFSLDSLAHDNDKRVSPKDESSLPSKAYNSGSDSVSFDCIYVCIYIRLDVRRILTAIVLAHKKDRFEADDMEVYF